MAFVFEEVMAANVGKVAKVVGGWETLERRGMSVTTCP